MSFSFDNPKNERTIFVGNLPVTTAKKELLKLFKGYGKVESVRFRGIAPSEKMKANKKAAVIKRQYSETRHNINAYVVFKDTESARKALDMNGKEVNGLHVRVDMAQQQRADDRLSVFIGNLPPDTEEEELRAHFSDCGLIENCRVVRDVRGKCKGIAFVEFKDMSSVADALLRNDSQIEGQTRKIRVQKCGRDKGPPPNTRRKVQAGKRGETSGSSRTVAPQKHPVMPRQRKERNVVQKADIRKAPAEGNEVRVGLDAKQTDRLKRHKLVKDKRRKKQKRKHVSTAVGKSKKSLVSLW